MARALGRLTCAMLVTEVREAPHVVARTLDRLIPRHACSRRKGSATPCGKGFRQTHPLHACNRGKGSATRCGKGFRQDSSPPPPPPMLLTEVREASHVVARAFRQTYPRHACSRRKGSATPCGKGFTQTHRPPPPPQCL